MTKENLRNLSLSLNLHNAFAFEYKALFMYKKVYNY
jgi:hypothetical protein